MQGTLVRRALEAGADAVTWVVAIVAATFARHDFSLTAGQASSALKIGLFAAVVQIVGGAMVHLYRGGYVQGSFEQVLAISQSVALTTALTFAAVWFRPEHGVPLSAVIVAGAVCLLLMLLVRFTVRAHRDRGRRPADSAEPVIVLGAGEAGEQLVRSIQRDRLSPYRVVGLLDDDPAKSHLRLSGIPVLGGRDQLEIVATERGAGTVIVAIAGADPELLNDVSDRAQRARIRVKVIPSLVELMTADVDVSDVRDLSIADLLRRRPVATDLTDIRELLLGKRVLITGAGGSIGAELSRQVHAFDPGSLYLLDRDESALHALQLSISGRALLDDDNVVLADIRDAQRMNQIMTTLRPDIVFHAAALKHLPLLERYPDEAYKTNVLGTLNVLSASREAGVPLFVNISTDKAADPCNVLGYSKRLTERLTAGAASDGDATYVSVRFGNVLGSRGSVLIAFAAQIDAGGPVTVTDPDVTRYFMSIPEAVQLVLQAAAVGRNGEALVLEMGAPVKIADVARQMIEHSGRDIEIVYTGLRDGEKLHEELFGADECDDRPAHPLISHVDVPPLHPDELGPLAEHMSSPALAQAMRRLAWGHHDPVLAFSPGSGMNP